MKTLVIGIGNAGRQDDGLGPALIERLAGFRPPERAIVKTAEGKADAFWAYQLNIEDASFVQEYDRIIFIDAAAEAPRPVEPGQELPGPAVLPALGERAGPTRPLGVRQAFGSPTRPLGVRIAPIEPAVSIAFTSHEMSPASVVALGEELYGQKPAAFLLTIRGFQWDFKEGITPEAEKNLAEAERILKAFRSND